MKGYERRADSISTEMRGNFPFIILYQNMLVSAKTKYYTIHERNLPHELFSLQKLARKNSALSLFPRWHKT